MLLELPAWTIALIRGEVMGGTLEGALACDRVYCTAGGDRLRGRYHFSVQEAPDDPQASVAVLDKAAGEDLVLRYKREDDDEDD